MFKSVPPKTVTCLKNKNRTLNGSTDLAKIQNDATRENMSASTEIAATDIEGQHRRSVKV